MKPLIVLATDSREPSGVGAHMIALAKGLSTRFEVIIASQGDGAGMVFLERAAAAGLRIKAIDPDRPRAVQAWLQERGVALLHVHAGIGWEGHELVRCGKAAGVRVVRTEHLPYLVTDVVQQAEYRAMIGLVDRSIAVSEAVRDSQGDSGVEHQAVILNGIEPPPALRTREAVRAELGLAAGQKLVLTIARFTPQKGLDVLVAAAPAVLARSGDVKFMLVGTGPERDSIVAAIGERHLDASFILAGSRSDIADLLAAADLFVLPSHFEGLPLVLLEAMAAGVPIAATAIGGTVEALGPGHPFLAPPGDPAALADAICNALAAPAQTGSDAAAAQARFARHFTADRMATQTIALYSSLLGLAPLRTMTA